MPKVSWFGKCCGFRYNARSIGEANSNFYATEWRWPRKDPDYHQFQLISNHGEAILGKSDTRTCNKDAAIRGCRKCRLSLTASASEEGISCHGFLSAEFVVWHRLPAAAFLQVRSRTIDIERLLEPHGVDGNGEGREVKSQFLNAEVGVISA